MDIVKSILWFAAIFIGAHYLRRLYCWYRFKSLADHARYQWHLLDRRQKTLVLCAQWMDHLNTYLDDDFIDQEGINKLFDIASEFTSSEDRSTILFESVLIEIWDSMKISGDYDLLYVKIELSKLFINYEERGIEFTRHFDKFKSELQAGS